MVKKSYNRAKAHRETDPQPQRMLTSGCRKQQAQARITGSPTRQTLINQPNEVIK